MGSTARATAAGVVMAVAPIADETPVLVRLRGAVEADVPALVRLERASFTDPWDAPAFRALLQAAAARVTVAERAGVLVGYSAVLQASDEAELANLAVDTAVQGRGIGRALLSAALAAAEADGVRAMYLEVRESNATARHLYEALGFATVGRRRGYYRQPDEDALVMQWRATDPEARSAG
jgi:[ribosomal protein S18]-alanine N-acetyltransferase